MIISLLAALASALCYGVAAVLQAIAVRAASRRTPELSRVDPGLVVRMLRQGRFLGSLAIDLVGFIAQLVALRHLPLFAVQAIMAANLAVTAVLASLVMSARLARREWLAVGTVVAGVAMLGLSAGTPGTRHASTAFVAGLAAAVLVIGAAGFALARLRIPARTSLLGVAAGLGYGAVGVSARILPAFSPLPLLRSPVTYTLLGAAVIAFVLYATALEGGSVTTATAGVVLAETLPPAIAGIAFLGDTTRSGQQALAAVGFLLAVLGALALARFGEGGAPSQGQELVPGPAAAGRAGLPAGLASGTGSRGRS